MGSKNKISKYIIPIIESYLTSDKKLYIEPFVGGANIIDKINFKNKLGSDNNEYLIELLRYIQDLSNDLPKSFTREEYYNLKENIKSYPKWYVGLVAFCGSYGAKWFGGYAKSPDTETSNPRNRVAEAINNLEKQRKNLQGIKFVHKSFEEYSKIENAVIYCDIPYKSVTSYKEKFNHNEFYNWCKKMKANNNVVLVSEYNMPEEFECIWEKEHKTTLGSSKHESRVERLYILK